MAYLPEHALSLWQMLVRVALARAGDLLQQWRVVLRATRHGMVARDIQTRGAAWDTTADSPRSRSRSRSESSSDGEASEGEDWDFWYEHAANPAVEEAARALANHRAIAEFVDL